MRVNKTRISFINIFLCIVFIVCSLYYDPLVVSVSNDSCDNSTILSRLYYINTVESEPELLANKSEQLITYSIKGNTTRRSYDKSMLSVGENILSETCGFCPFRLTKAQSILLISGAHALFRNTLLFVWSQIGL